MRPRRNVIILGNKERPLNFKRSPSPAALPARRCANCSSWPLAWLCKLNGLQERTIAIVMQVRVFLIALSYVNPLSLVQKPS